MERRRDLRFEIRLTCRLQAVGHSKSIEGTTLNLSRSGALIRIPEETLLQPGDLLLAEVLLPANRMFKPRCLSCKGVAVRRDAEAGGWTVAVQFEHVEFRPLANAAAASVAPVAM